ncbi:MAG: hypothetical protein FWB99_04455, partial [Treponema sp.]|nr:hypothetical protein [Treponema sp.]
AVVQDAPPPPPTEPPIVGTIVPGDTLADKFAWLQRSANSHGVYILEVNANQNIAPQNLNFPGGINITVVLRGYEENRTLRLSANGVMFTVAANVTFILDENITLHGHPQNNGPMVNVNGGIFRMRSDSIIMGNTNTHNSTTGGAVRVHNGQFIMTGGTIYGNTSNVGGGVVVTNNGNFTLSGGSIYGNTATSAGGGVHHNGPFQMTSGSISGNTAPRGGGIFFNGGGFTMQHGTISGNTASRGGGIFVYTLGAAFTMQNGIIANNTAAEFGGGVFLGRRHGGQFAQFTKNRGSITSFVDDQENGNVVRDSDGNVLARRGHAVSFNEHVLRRESSAGPGVTLSIGRGPLGQPVPSGGWES